MIYFHYCQVFLSTADEAVQRQTNKVLTECQTRSSLSGVGKITPFSGSIFILKLKSPYAEVILEERRANLGGFEYLVYFVRGLKKGLSGYVEIRDGKWLQNNPLPAQEEQNMLAQLSSRIKSESSVTKQKIPNEKVSWHSDYKLRVDFDVFETETWYNYSLGIGSSGMDNKDVRLFAILLRNVLIENSIPTVELSSCDDSILKRAEYEGVGVVFSETKLHDRTVYVLHLGYNCNNSSKDLAIRQQSEIIFNYASLEILCSQTLRAYPKWTFNDSELWSRIQKNSEIGNLSLLPEQTEFLRNFKFPKYINGQAGSGKSTLLYYLFANAFYYKIQGSISGDIIFLTENEKLLQHTKSSIIELLTSNSEFEISSDYTYHENLDNCFYSFKDYLLSLLPEDCADFPNDKYLNFSKFKNLYESSTIALSTRH